MSLCHLSEWMCWSNKQRRLPRNPYGYGRQSLNYHIRARNDTELSRVVPSNGALIRATWISDCLSPAFRHLNLQLSREERDMWQRYCRVPSANSPAHAAASVPAVDVGSTPVGSTQPVIHSRGSVEQYSSAGCDHRSTRDSPQKDNVSELVAGWRADGWVRTKPNYLTIMVLAVDVAGTAGKACVSGGLQALHSVSPLGRGVSIYPPRHSLIIHINRTDISHSESSPEEYICTCCLTGIPTATAHNRSRPCKSTRFQI